MGFILQNSERILVLIVFWRQRGAHKDLELAWILYKGVSRHIQQVDGSLFASALILIFFFGASAAMIKTYSRRGIYTMVSSDTSTSRFMGLFCLCIRSLLPAH